MADETPQIAETGQDDWRRYCRCEALFMHECGCDPVPTGSHR